MANYVDLTTGMVRDWIPVTTNNSADNMGASSQNTVIGFYITVGGAVVFTVDGTDRTVTFPSNFYVPCSNVTRIKATGTTATGIHSLVI
jgi:hypothetical protein